MLTLAIILQCQKWIMTEIESANWNFLMYRHNGPRPRPSLSQSTVVLCIIGMDGIFQHHAHTFEKSDLNFQFQYEFSSVTAEW